MQKDEPTVEAVQIRAWIYRQHLGKRLPELLLEVLNISIFLPKLLLQISPAYFDASSLADTAKPMGKPCIYRPKYSEGVIRCQSGLGEWFRASQRGVKSLKNQLYGFVSLSCV